jgi:aspartyl/asparaginyl beta-hydroxylase (cupin superfamily)
MKTDERLRKKKREIIINVGFKLICALESLIARLSPVGDHNIFPADQFKWVSRIEANWKTIRQELEEILKYRDKLPNFQDISKDQYQFTTDDKWKTYFLYCFGYKSENNCVRCPETTKLIESVSGKQTAFFSILSAHKHIPRHRGIYKGLIRYHLGLIIPQPNNACRIQIGDDITCWEEGKSLIFDDTYHHQVWNDTDGERVVLLMDVMRPLPFPFSTLNKLIIYLVGLSPFVQDGIKNEIEWEKTFHGTVKYP